jgi:ppGpp synthetase/RelA/SpoT-type nucleotidyltranferase
MIVCRYIDGTALVARTLHAHATDLALDSRFGSRENDAGYYAFHFYACLPVQISDMDWNAVEIPLSIEIQLTTQLQEVLKDLTHGFYEEARLRYPESDEDWKWQFETLRFKGSYIGHTLHLLEGIIVSLKTEVQTRAGATPDADEN